MENTIQCPYCVEDIKKDAQICKHCGKKVQFKIKELEKEREKQKKYDERSKTKLGSFINVYSKHKFLYTVLIIGGAIFYLSLSSAIKSDKAFNEKYNKITEANKTPSSSCYYAKEEIRKQLGNVNFYNDCKIATPGAFRDYVVGSYPGASYYCDVMYFNDKNFSEAKCTLYR